MHVALKRAKQHTSHDQNLDSVKCANQSFHMGLQNILDWWNSRLFTFVVCIVCDSQDSCRSGDVRFAHQTRACVCMCCTVLLIGLLA